MGNNVRDVDWSRIKLEPFVKAFYQCNFLLFILLWKISYDFNILLIQTFININKFYNLFLKINYMLNIQVKISFKF